MSLSLFYCQNVCLVCYFLFSVDLRDAGICSKLICMKASSTLQLTHSFLMQCYIFDNIFHSTIITCFFDITTNSPIAMLSFTYLKIKNMLYKMCRLCIFLKRLGVILWNWFKQYLTFWLAALPSFLGPNFWANNHLLAHVTLRKTSRSLVLFWKPGVCSGNGSWGLLSWRLSAVTGPGGAAISALGICGLTPSLNNTALHRSAALSKEAHSPMK